MLAADSDSWGCPPWDSVSCSIASWFYVSELRDTLWLGLETNKIGGVMKYWSKSIVLLAVALGLLASCAEMGMDDPIKARQNLMRDNNSNVKAIGAFLKENKGSAADVASRARKVAANAKQIPGLFPAQPLPDTVP